MGGGGEVSSLELATQANPSPDPGFDPSPPRFHHFVLALVRPFLPPPVPRAFFTPTDSMPRPHPTHRTMFKCLPLLALLGVACAFMGHMPSSTRSRGRVSASLADLEAKLASRPLSAKGPMAAAPAPVKQSGFSLFGSKSATSAPTTATKSTVVAKTTKPTAVKVTKEMARALSAPAAVVTRVKSGTFC